MYNSDKQFENCWDKYKENIHSKIIVFSKNEELTIALANLALKEATTDWFSQYNSCGGWLSKLSQENKTKSNEILNILKNEIKFSNEQRIKKLNKLVIFGIPATIAIVFIVTARFFNMNIKMQIIPIFFSFFIFFILNNSKDQIKNQSQKNAIIGYLEQLDIFKQKILKILNMQGEGYEK